MITLASRDERVRKWRELARQALAEVDHTSDPDVKAIFRSIASEYTAVADMADSRRLKCVSGAPQAGVRQA